MGRRDFGKHEVRKPKKDGKKTIVGIGAEIPPPEVEVIKRKRKEQEQF